MTKKEEFKQAGFSVLEAQQTNELEQFIKTKYPQIIKDGEIKLDELKSALNLPIDDKVNGYGLNFVGRNVAKAKCKQKTDKCLKINEKLSKDFDTTQNLVLKGDNLDCLKILKDYYGGKIKMIYIDPPYNTESEKFVYPDKFDKEE
jgi:adenine-specific DNA-methyltransferase